MADLVVKKDVGTEGLQEHPLVQAAQEQRLVDPDIPGSQGSDHPFVRRRAPGRHKGGSYRRSVARILRLDAVQRSQKALECATR